MMHQKAQLGGVRHRACTRCDAVEGKHDLLQARIGIYRSVSLAQYRRLMDC